MGNLGCLDIAPNGQNVYAPRMPFPPAETAAEHLRNALGIVRLTLETAEPAIGHEGPGFIVTADTLGRLQARIEAALERLTRPPEA